MFDTWTLVCLLLAAAVISLLITAALRPGAFSVSRSLVISAPPENIFPMINDLQAMNRWNPFVKTDPAIRLSYSGPESGKGAASDWDGNAKAGKGRVEIAESSPFTSVVMSLHMMKPMKTTNRIDFTLEPLGAATRVTWAMSGPNLFIGKLMGLFVNMDAMVGGQFEKGLADLKAMAEN